MFMGCTCSVLTVSTLEMIGRGDAVKRLAASIADRTAFVVIIPPGRVDAAATALRRVPDWTAYLDNGTGIVMTTGDPAHVYVVGVLAVTAMVVEVPKTVPGRVLSRALSEDIPDDGSRDLIICYEEEGRPISWPTLFVDALRRVDPKAANQIEFGSLGHTS